MPTQTRSKGLDPYWENVQELNTEIARLKKELAAALRRIRREQAASGALASRLNSAPRPAYANKGISPPSTPLGSRRSKRKSGSPSGGISKTPPGSKGKARSTTPPGRVLVKRNGRLVSNNQVVIPQCVLEGPAVNRFPHLDAARTKGMWNKGNFCYRNSLLQAVLHVPAFYRYLGKMHKDCRLERTACVVCALQDLAHAYWNDESAMSRRYANRRSGPYHAITRLNDAVKENLPGDGLREMREDYEHENQADTWDFLQYLLRHIEDKELRSDDTPFRDVFQFAIEATWTCGGCGHTSTYYSHEQSLETGIDLRIDQPRRGLTLLEYLEEYFKESMEIRCPRNLPGCNGPAEDQPRTFPMRSRLRRMDQPPQMLMICLNRFVAPAFSGTRVDAEAVKIRNDVPFDEYLNMGPFTKDGNDILYRLDGVVAHIGPTITSGHYIASFRSHTGQNFLTANDDRFHGTSAAGRGTFLEMRRPMHGGTAIDPYVLLYSKV